jgi:Bacterial Ig-like domain
MPLSVVGSARPKDVIDLISPADGQAPVPDPILETGAIATAFANLRTDTQVTVDLRTLFTSPDGAPMTFVSNVGVVAGNTLTWTPSYNEWLLYGSIARLTITISVTDTEGRVGISELVNQSIALINTAPVGASGVMAFPVPVGTAPVFSSSVPANGATGVLVGANITMTFDRSLAWLASGSIRIRKAADDTVFEDFSVATDIGSGAGKMSIATTAIGLTKTTNYAYGTSYYMDWDACFSNISGVPAPIQTSKTFLAFTTEAAPAVLTLIQSASLLNDTVSSSSTATKTSWTGGAINVGTGTNRGLVFNFAFESNQAQASLDNATITATYNGQTIVIEEYKYNANARAWLAIGRIIAPTSGTGTGLSVTTSTAQRAGACCVSEWVNMKQTGPIIVPALANANSGSSSVTTRTLNTSGVTTAGSVVISAMCPDERSASAVGALTCTGATLMQSIDTGNTDLSDLTLAVGYELLASTGVAFSHVFSWTGATRCIGASYELLRA